MKAKSDKAAKKPQKPSIVRAILGAVVSWAFFAICAFLMLWAYVIGLTDNSTVIPNWILTVVLVLLIYLFVYGVLGSWLSDMALAKNKLVRIVGNIFGFIGLILRPYVLKAFGANKKWLFLLLTGLPILIIGILGLVEFTTGSILSFVELPKKAHGTMSRYGLCIMILAIVHCLFVLTVKKCPNCKCIMTEIDTDERGYQSEIYTRDFSERIGLVDGTDVNLIYQREFEGDRETISKIYRCRNCGCERVGKGVSFLKKAPDDFVE